MTHILKRALKTVGGGLFVAVVLMLLARPADSGVLGLSEYAANLKMLKEIEI